MKASESSAPSAAQLSSRSQVERYRIERLIGQGAFAQVYLAIDTADLRHPERALLRLIELGDAEEIAIRRHTFQRTAAILEKIHHPAIPRIYRIFEAENRLYLVQQFVAGISYQQSLQQSSSLTSTALEQSLREILGGLASLHQAGIVHGDIKPSNLMRRDADSSTAIIDFGSATELSKEPVNYSAIANNNPDGIETVIGRTGLYTPSYAHPEQQRQPTTPQSWWDLHALAKTFVALQVGQEPPWSELPKLSALGFNLPMQQLLTEMLSLKGTHFQDASGALQRLDQLCDRKPSIVRQTLPEKSLKLNPWVLLGGGLGLGLVSTGLTLAFFLRSPQIGKDSCPKLAKSEVGLPVPDRGFAARFYYPTDAPHGSSLLQIWRGDNLIAEATDSQIQGFIWIKSLIGETDFPRGEYDVTLSVPGQKLYVEVAQLTDAFPFHYIGKVTALKLACSQPSSPSAPP